MDKIVFPILLSLLCGTVFSASLADTNLNKDYEDRLDEARERALTLIAELLSDDTSLQDQQEFTGLQDGGDDDDVSDINIPMLESLLVENSGGGEVIDAEEATELILESLANNGRSLDDAAAKRAGSLDCLQESCEDVERRRQPSRNAHYRTLPFGKREQRQTFSTVRNTRKSAVKNKNKSRVRPPLLPFGK